MSATSRLFLCLAALTMGLFMVCAPGFAQETGNIADKPVVAFKAPQLKDWQNASEQERYAFLIGIAAMLDAEREWQSPKMLPVSQSTVGMWSRALSDVSFREMHDAVNAYIAANPDKMDDQVLRVLGRIYVEPRLTEKERAQATAHYDKILKARNR